ncbi:MAG: ATP-binding protein, partial [Chitinophagaceae bacterium]
GEITLWVGTATDIDDQKNLEEELRKLQALEKSVRLGAEAQTAWFNDMVMQAPFIICTFRGPDHVHELINPPYQELFGDKQLIGRTVIKALPEFGGQVFVEILDMVYKRGETISRKEVSLLIPGKLTKNLEENFVNFTCQPLYDFEKKVEGILVFAYNVTDQVLARRILEKNAEDLNIILEAIPQIAWVSKPDGSIFYYNSNWYHYTGLTIAETEKDGWWPVLHPSLRDKTMEEWLHAVQTCEIFEMETLLKRSADQSYRWHLSKAAPVRNKLGDVTLWVGTFTDINHENNLRGELENLVLERTKEVMLSNEELKLSNIKLEEFAFVASHDLKEPLRKIITNSDFLQMEFGDQLNNTGKQYIHRIHESAFRMQKLIEDLLSFSQLSHNVLDYKTIDLKQLVNSIIAEQFLVDKEEMATITIKKLPVIECIPTMIEQLFTNLLSNALKFVKPGIPAKIEISFNYISGSHTGIPSAQPHEKFCRIYVKDNGIGFDKKYLEQIFIIFKRLNSQNKYQGTGIGLALCKKIVENHHGSLTANSRLNDGATFIIILPCKQRKF